MNHIPQPNVDSWIAISLAALGSGVAARYRKAISKTFNIVVMAIRNIDRVVMINQELQNTAEELTNKLRFSEASKNDYKVFCSELDEHLNRISLDLDAAKKELMKFRDVMDTQEQVINVLSTDRDTAFAWGRALSKQIADAGLVPVLSEPSLVSLKNTTNLQKV